MHQHRVVWLVDKAEPDTIISSPGPRAMFSQDPGKFGVWTMPEAPAGEIEAWIRDNESHPGAIKIEKLGTRKHRLPVPNGLCQSVSGSLIGTTRVAELPPDLAFAFKMRFG